MPVLCSECGGQMRRTHHPNEIEGGNRDFTQLPP